MRIHKHNFWQNICFLAKWMRLSKSVEPSLSNQHLNTISVCFHRKSFTICPVMRNFWMRTLHIVRLYFSLQFLYCREIGALKTNHFTFLCETGSIKKLLFTTNKLYTKSVQYYHYRYNTNTYICVHTLYDHHGSHSWISSESLSSFKIPVKASLSFCVSLAQIFWGSPSTVSIKRC